MQRHSQTANHYYLSAASIRLEIIYRGSVRLGYLCREHVTRLRLDTSIQCLQLLIKRIHLEVHLHHHGALAHDEFAIPYSVHVPMLGSGHAYSLPLEAGYDRPLDLHQFDKNHGFSGAMGILDLQCERAT